MKHIFPFWLVILILIVLIADVIVMLLNIWMDKMSINTLFVLITFLFLLYTSRRIDWKKSLKFKQ